MSSISALIKSDLSSMRLVLPDRGEIAWNAPADPEDGATASDHARIMRSRAGEAAQWIASQANVRRRLRLAVLDVDDALCIWLKPSSLAGPVLGAAFRSACEDWGEEGAAYTPEPLIRTTTDRPTLFKGLPGKSAATDDEAEEPTSATACAVIGVRDPLIRLWLDAMDQRGLHPECVMTLWHALAHAWQDPVAETVATVLVTDQHRLIWAWHSGADLIAAGVATTGAAHDEQTDSVSPATHAASRVSLDWLTWAAQSGRAPEHIQVIGHNAEAIGEALAKSWGQASWGAQPTDDPIAETLRRAAAQPSISTPGDGRRRLSRLESRPTRATRRQYQVIGAALLLGAIACISLAGRLLDERKAMNALWIDQRSAMTDRIRQVWPNATIAPGISPVQLAGTQLQDERTRPRFTPPPAPRPILAEAHRIMNALLDPFTTAEATEQVASAENGDESPIEFLPPPTDLRLLILSMDQQNTVQVRVSDRRETNLLTQRFRAPGFAIDWNAGGRTSVNPLEPEFIGQWK